MIVALGWDFRIAIMALFGDFPMSSCHDRQGRPGPIASGGYRADFVSARWKPILVLAVVRTASCGHAGRRFRGAACRLAAWF